MFGIKAKYYYLSLIAWLLISRLVLTFCPDPEHPIVVYSIGCSFLALLTLGVASSRKESKEKTGKYGIFKSIVFYLLISFWIVFISTKIAIFVLEHFA